MIARGERRLGLLLLAPALAVLALVTLYPVLQVLWLSLQRRVPVFGIAEPVGLAHYGFLARDPAFWNAVRVTLGFVVSSVALEVLGGAALALALWRQRRARPLAIGLLLMPWCLPGVVTARTFEWLYHPTTGLVTRLVALAGAPRVNWLGDPSFALPAMVAADAWRTVPFVALLCYARLVSIPPEVHEAATVDGATALRSFRWVTLPLLAPILVVAALFRTLDALRAFDLPFVLTAGGPAGTTETLPLYAYRSLFQILQLGFGAAVSTVVFALVTVTAWLYLGAVERQEART